MLGAPRHSPACAALVEDGPVGTEVTLSRFPVDVSAIFVTFDHGGDDLWLYDLYGLVAPWIRYPTISDIQFSRMRLPNRRLRMKLIATIFSLKVETVDPAHDARATEYTTMLSPKYCSDLRACFLFAPKR
jgi:hypothetical protein